MSAGQREKPDWHNQSSSSQPSQTTLLNVYMSSHCWHRNLLCFRNCWSRAACPAADFKPSSSKANWGVGAKTGRFKAEHEISGASVCNCQRYFLLSLWGLGFPFTLSYHVKIIQNLWHLNLPRQGLVVYQYIISGYIDVLRLIGGNEWGCLHTDVTAPLWLLRRLALST